MRNVHVNHTGMGIDRARSSGADSEAMMLHYVDEPTIPSNGKGYCLPYALSALTGKPINDAILETGYDNYQTLNWRRVFAAIPKEWTLLVVKGRRCHNLVGYAIQEGRTVEYMPRQCLRKHLEAGRFSRGIIVTKHRYRSGSQYDHAIALDDPLVSDNRTFILAREYYRRFVKYAFIER